MNDLFFDMSIVRDGSCLTVTLKGELDYGTAPELEDGLNGALTQEIQVISIDFCDLAFIDSEGIKVLITSYQKLHARGGSIHVLGCSKRVAATFRLLGLTDFFEGCTCKNTEL